MKDYLGFLQPRVCMIGVSALAGVALFSSFYLQYVAGYQPCIYCNVLRYLTVGILLFSLAGLLLPGRISEVSAALAAAGLVGSAVSVYLIANQLFPSAQICTVCSVTPFIFGISIYYYSLTFMAIVLGIPISLLGSSGGHEE